MNSGCICCSLVGDFGRALTQVITDYQPDRILIEPSGVGKLSDVIIAVQDLENEEIQLNGFTTVVDAKKAKMYLKNFGEFYVNQVEHASSIILSHVQGLSQEKIDQVIGLLREHNTEASIVTTDWKEISGKKILETMEQKKTLSAELDHLREEAHREQEEHEAESGGNFRSGGAGGNHGSPGIGTQYQYNGRFEAGHRRPNYGVQSQYDHSAD